jgi:CrcB protein
VTAARVVWVFVGGGIGSVARYALGTLLLERVGPAFPWGTLAVNLLGSALLGALVQISLATDAVSTDLRVALATGLLGGFTTYSAFSQETFAYLQDGAWLLGAAYAAVTLAGCLAASLAGHLAARSLVGG